MSERLLVAGCRPWAQRAFEDRIRDLSGEWRYVDSPEDLDRVVVEWRPVRTYFLHWSWVVGADILDATECINFHMTDVPYGRGGSPLQNLIVRGHKTTKLSALRMTQDLDAGPVYAKAELSLSGTADEIYARGCELAAEMVVQIETERPEPIDQKGEPVVFRRRRPEDSEISDLEGDLDRLFDHIRMLDADGYPQAYLDHNGFRYAFRSARIESGEIRASVVITPRFGGERSGKGESC